MPRMHDLTIGFIGAGNMAEALLCGLLAQGHPAERIVLSDIDQRRLQALARSHRVAIAADNASLAVRSDIVVFAVKPQHLRAVLTALPALSPDTTLISIAAGRTMSMLRSAWGGDDAAWVRVMPNTPALLGAGMSVLYTEAGSEHRRRAQSLFACVGKVAWVEDESQLDAVTAISGSGPAYFFLLAEIMQRAGVSMGLPESLAAELASQTALGAGRMLAESGREARVLREQVTSPGGTTQAALECMLAHGLEEALQAGMRAAEQRARELGECMS